MSDAYEPISPSEAGRILAQSRLDRDAAHERRQIPPEATGGEDFLTGKQSIEASQGWSEMPLANDIRKQADEPIDGAEVSEALRSTQAQVAEPIPVQYLEQRGERTGQPMDERLSVSPEQAAHDLNHFRDQTALMETGREVLEIQKAVDELRQSDAPELPNDVAATPEAQPQAPAGDDEVVKLLQSSPKLLDLINKELGQHSAQADQIAQRYINATAVNAQSAYANMVASFPEIANVPADRLGTALQVLAQSNPEKAQAITRHVETVTKLTQEAQRAQVAAHLAQQQEARRQFDVAATNADRDLEAHALSQVSADQYHQIQNEARSMMHDYGINEQELTWHWQNNPGFRSLPVQKMMMDAARWRLSQRGLKEKVVKTAPPVVRPGSPLERGSDQDYQLDRLNAKLNSSGSVKDAAALLIARRGRR
jgi:hypothetical protein